MERYQSHGTTKMPKQNCINHHSANFICPYNKIIRRIWKR